MATFNHNDHPPRLPKTYGPQPVRRIRRIRRSQIFWERLGVIVSAVGILFAAAALWFSGNQTSIMAKQLNAELRNASYVEFSQTLEKYCGELGPLFWRRKPGSALPSISEFQKVTTGAGNLSDELINAAMVLQIAVDRDKEAEIGKFINSIRSTTFHINMGIKNRNIQRYEMGVSQLDINCKVIRYSLLDWFKRGANLIPE